MPPLHRFRFKGCGGTSTSLIRVFDSEASPLNVDPCRLGSQCALASVPESAAALLLLLFFDFRASNLARSGTNTSITSAGWASGATHCLRMGKIRYTTWCDAQRRKRSGRWRSLTAPSPRKGRTCNRRSAKTNAFLFPVWRCHLK